MRAFGALMVAGWLLLLSSCGGGDRSEPSMSIGEYCDSTGTAFCQRVQDCKLSSFSACFKLFQADCCLDDMSCDERPKETASLRALEERCVSALTEQTCADVEAELVPDACGTNP
jgi:hypothetical protein